MVRDNFDFSQIDGIGPILAANLSSWVTDNLCSPNSKYIHLLNRLTLNDAPVLQNTKTSSIAGKTFVITGELVNYPNRDALVSEIEANGGKVSSSVSSKTNYLINNDVTSNSSKNKKAKELNIPIISENEFITLLSPTINTERTI